MDDHLAFARKSTLREYSESIGVAVAVALLLRAFVVEAFQIPSGSMIPTLEVGDHIFVSKFAYGVTVPFTNSRLMHFGQPERGDVVVFSYPMDPSTDYIKRVVGLPGDTVEIRHEDLYVNGQAVPRQRVPRRLPLLGEHPTSTAGCPTNTTASCGSRRSDKKQHETIVEPGRGGRDFGRTVVPRGHVFVMGDNRDNSSDSRVWGTVDVELIKGKALIVWWSRATSAGFSPVSWLKSIRWSRFFHVVR